MFTGKMYGTALLVLVCTCGLAMGQVVAIDLPTGDTLASLADPWIETTDSGCLNMGSGAARIEGEEEPLDVGPCEERDVITYVIDGCTVHAIHKNATYNCCPDYFDVRFDIERNRITLIEKEILTNPCKCICCYDIKSAIYALPPGEYYMRYCWYDYETETQVCDYQWIRVPECIRVEYGHDDCTNPTSISDRLEVGPCEERDEITYEADERMLRVFHDNATYNCCLDDIIVELDVDNHTLLFREQEILTDPCRCVCCYNVWARVFGLEPGEYRTKYCWYDYETHTDVCDEQFIRIP